MTPPPESPKPPEGAKPIAREPTEAMIDAALAAVGPHTAPRVSIVWRAMWDAAPSPEAVGLWQPIETAPKGRKVIVGYPNKLGNWRSVMAIYYRADTLPDGEGGYAPEGWYEECESNPDDQIYFTDERPTHWMPLPKPPVVGQEGPSEPEGGG